MAITGIIADKARDELPATWDALSKEKSAGEEFLQRKLNSVMVELFGTTALSVDDQADLPEIVTDYAGKKLALRLINPAIDHWSKQPTSLGATGRNEVKSWKDRADGLKDLRAQLLAEVADMYPTVKPLLPVMPRPQHSVPVVTEPTTAFTPDPNLMEPVFDVSALDTGG